MAAQRHWKQQIGKTEIRTVCGIPGDAVVDKKRYMFILDQGGKACNAQLDVYFGAGMSDGALFTDKDCMKVGQSRFC